MAVSSSCGTTACFDQYQWNIDSIYTPTWSSQRDLIDERLHKRSSRRRLCKRGGQGVTNIPLFLNVNASANMATTHVMDSGEFKRIAVAVVTVVGTGSALFSTLEGWRLVDSFYFITVSLSSIGYGDFTPSSPLSRILLVTFVLTFMGLFSFLVEEFAGLRERWLHNQLHRSKRYRFASRSFRQVVLAGVAFGHAVLIGAAVLSVAEGWSFGQACYFCCITLTTVRRRHATPRCCNVSHR